MAVTVIAITCGRTQLAAAAGEAVAAAAAGMTGMLEAICTVHTQEQTIYCCLQTYMLLSHCTLYSRNQKRMFPFYPPAIIGVTIRVQYMHNKSAR